MKSFATLALFLCSFAAFAEDAEKPMEHASNLGVFVFFAIVIASAIWFVIAMNKASKKAAAEKAAENK